MGEKSIWEEYGITDYHRLKYVGDEVDEILSIILKNVKVGIGLFEVGETIRALYLNEAYFECIGYTVEEYQSKIDNIFSTLLEEDAKGFYECIMEHAPKVEKIYYTIRGYRADGSIGCFQIKGVPLQNRINDNPVYLTVISDISDQLDREEKIRQLQELNTSFLIQEERYKILEATTQALLFEFYPDQDLMIFSYNFPNNKKQKEIAHYSVYQKRFPFVHSSCREEFQQTLANACRKETEGTIEYLSSISGGGYRWMRTYYKSIADANGKIASVMGRIEDIHDAKMEKELLNHKAYTDGLTGLYRKEAAFEKMQEYVDESPESEFYFSVVDLDGFKKINDEYGHQYGDKVLKEMAVSLLKAFGENSIIGRFGGDEFIVLTKNISLPAVEEIFMQQTEKIHFSVGTVRWNLGETIEEVFERADQAMYRSKGERRE